MSHTKTAIQVTMVTVQNNLYGLKLEITRIKNTSGHYFGEGPMMKGLE